VPAKLVFGILGGITGGASYVLTGGNTDTANTIWRSSLGGDYVLTPDMVAGQKPIHFSGPTTSASPAMPASFAPPATSSSMNSTAQPMPAGTVSAANAAGVGSAPVAGTSAPGAAAAQPADRGAGPVSSSRAMSGGVAAPALPGTSIE